MKEEFLKHLQRILREDQRALEENMSSHVTFRTGGPAEYYVRPNRQQIQPVLELCRRFDVPWMVIGNGSNLLVGDRGIRGLVMEIGRMMDRISIDGELVTAEAGALLSSAARYAAKESLTGMEFASGIPGTVGGAVVMNAGAYGGEIKQILKSVTVLTEDGQERELGAEELDLGYRHSCILERRLIVLEAKLQLSKGNPEEISDRMEELKNRRVEKQPLEYPSAGSTFKRPEGYFAGKLIQDTGLRGYQVGGAQVSEKHCGFVINREKAVSKDIRQLITDVQDRVEAQFGVRLEPEVKFIGDF
ncbi:UDP-N-acetylenolpyruvoylglucosamine reductase [Lachnospiraceae bacterium]|nr:UDP-N-acetylenolpyruvoylglucosamine reductase [Lachnospiraceae bacterium]